jgi:hypothetical protein
MPAHLPPVDTLMERLQSEIALLSERFAASERMLEVRSLEMLLAETALAAHAYRVARDAHLRLRARLHHLQAKLGSLILERETAQT